MGHSPATAHACLRLNFDSHTLPPLYFLELAESLFKGNVLT